MKEVRRSFTDLEAWKKARVLKNELKRLCEKFPFEEKFRLADQIVRSSRSIMANIAEGHGRFTFKEQLRFCIQARGSLSETLNHIIDALDCKYISTDDFVYFKSLIEETGKILNGYINYLRASCEK